jgi:sigma-B regulation protein RsbU (phosphoserine phosphatase)
MTSPGLVDRESDHQNAVLTVVNPSGHRSRVTLNQSPFLIGRLSENNLVLRDNRVSRVHARITFDQDGYYLEDLNSRHGTFLNGKRVTARTKLSNSDTIGFGFNDSYQLIFIQDEAELSRLISQVTISTRATTAGGNLAKLRALVEVARALQGHLSVNEVLDAVVDAALAVVGAQRGFLMLKAGDDLEIKVARDSEGRQLSKDDLKVPTRLIHRALHQRRELLSMHFDPSAEGATDPDVSVANLELRSVVCVPLVRVRTEITPETVQAALNETVGLIYLDSKVSVADLSSGNRELLQTLALEASTVIENARLLLEQQEKQRLEEELAIARRIQEYLLPKNLPQTGWFRIAGSSIASHQVGGDYFDVAPVGRGGWSMVVADVSGKGVSSALLAGFLQGAFLLGGDTPAQIREMLRRVNTFLYERTQGEKYATLFYGALLSDGTLHWANAGQCTPILLHRSGEMEALETTGMPVGILDIGEFEVRTLRLAPGDKLVIFSDGLTEAQNAAGQYFEMQRIRLLLRSCADMSCEMLHRTMLNAVTNFTGGEPQQDDVTLVVAEYLPVV